MTSKNLFSKLARDEARRNLWALALSILGFLLAAPLPLVIYLQNEWAAAERLGLTRAEMVQDMSDSITYYLTDVFPRLGLMIMATLCGVALFRFLHDRRQVDFYHSLPIRREGLYAVKFVTGLALVLPAYLAARLIAVLVAVGAGFGGAIEWGRLLECVGVDLLAFFTIYGIAILSTVLCGNTICAVVLDGVILFSAAVAAQIYETFAYWFYPAYANTGSGYAWMYSPVFGFLNLDEPNWYRMLAGYAAAGIAALALSYMLFRIRRSERAGQAIAFQPFRLPLKVYVCLVMGLGSGCILAGILGTADTVWLLLLTAVGTAACHCVVEVVYDADIRSMFRRVPALLAVTAAAVLLALGLKADIFGYSTWIPRESSVKWMELYNLYANDRQRGGNIGRYYDFARNEELTDPAVKQALLRLTELGVENLDLKSSGRAPYEIAEAVAERQGLINYYDITISYGMSGGVKKQRSYVVPMTEESEALVNAVLYSEDYLFWHNQTFRYEAFLQEHPELRPMAVVVDCMRERSLQTLHDEEQIAALVEALKADVLDFTPEQAEIEGPVFQLELSGVSEDQYEARYRSYATAVYPSYRRTLALLEEYAGIEPEPLRVEEIASVRIIDNRDREIRDPKADENRLATVSDPGEIETVLQGLVADEAGDRYGMRMIQQIEVMVMLTNGDTVHCNWQADAVPEELLARHLGAELSGEPAQGFVAETAQ